MGISAKGKVQNIPCRAYFQIAMPGTCTWHRKGNVDLREVLLGISNKITSQSLGKSYNLTSCSSIRYQITKILAETCASQKTPMFIPLSFRITKQYTSRCAEVKNISEGQGGLTDCDSSRLSLRRSVGVKSDQGILLICGINLQCCLARRQYWIQIIRICIPCKTQDMSASVLGCIQEQWSSSCI